ncbi:MAG: NAD(P)-dependent glycerol-3-phosphate dehydrogenase, partial [Nitrospirae bacterium]
MSYIAVIGAGSWGTAMALHLARKDYDVTIWAREPEVAEEINREGTNSQFLPEVQLPENLRATSSLEEALHRARYVLCAVPSQFVRQVFTEVARYIDPNSTVISLSKGIEKGTLLTVSQVLRQIIENPVAVLSGPSFAKEVAKGLPTAVTLAVEDPAVGLLLQEVFNTSTFRVYTHTDIIGVELGGALKNVIAIAAGIADGLGLGYNARAGLITRGLAEIVRLGVAMGAEPVTFSGLSGIGDLVLTCTGALSRNYTVGYKLGQGRKLREILSEMKEVAEGVETTASAKALAEKHGVEMPIVQEVYRVLYEERP